MPGMKVPVPLPHESALFSPEEGFPAIVDEGPRVRDEPFIGVLINRYAPVRQDLREVLLRVCPDGLDGAEGIVPVGHRPSVKTGQHRAHFVQAAIGELTLLNDLGKKPLFRDAQHLDRILDDHPAPCPPERVCLPLSVDGCDAEIDTFSQARIEPHFFGAEKPSLLNGREIEEPEVHRLLDLVDHGPAHEDMGDMGLMMDNASGLLGITLRVQQKGYEMGVGVHGSIAKKGKGANPCRFHPYSLYLSGPCFLSPSGLSFCRR